MSSRRKRQKTSNDGAETAVAQKNGNGSLESNNGEQPGNAEIVDLDREPTAKRSTAPRSLFVRSLPSSATTESLTEYFSQSFLLKHATLVLDPVTKKSRGFGFVTFVDSEDAQKAKDELDGSLFDGRKIKVAIAEPRHREVEEGGLSGPKKSRPNAQSIQSKAEREKKKAEIVKSPKLIVRNLPWSIKTPEQLSLLFRSYGKIKVATLPPPKDGLSSGFGFVVLRGRKNAEKALQGVNGKVVDGRTLAVDWAVEKDVWQTMHGKHGNGQDQKPDEDSNESLKSGEDNEGVPIGEIPPSDTEQDNGAASEDKEDMDSDALEESGAWGTDDDEDEADFEDEAPPKDPDLSSATLFIRNLPFNVSDEILSEHFMKFGPVRYARVVMDQATERSKGTAFVCFFNKEDATNCLRQSPKSSTDTSGNKKGKPHIKHSLLEDARADPYGHFTVDGRVLHVSRAVDRDEAQRLTVEGSSLREARERDRRRLYLLSEGTVPSNSPLYATLAPSERKLREDSAKQRQTLVKGNPSLHLSLIRLSVRNIGRHVTSKDLKALAREAVVGFSKDVKAGLREKLSAEEISRGGEEMREAERARKVKGKGIVKQAKVVFEGREGKKVTEDSGAGRSRGYGFIEYTTHRAALMGLRWLNGHRVERHTVPDDGSGNAGQDKSKRLIVEFAIENAQVVARRKEGEQKARETSRAAQSSQKVDETSKSNPETKTPSRDQLMKKTRLGMKRKRNQNGDTVVAQPSEAETSTKEGSSKLDKLARRQQIIGRKRHMRKARKAS